MRGFLNQGNLMKVISFLILLYSAGLFAQTSTSAQFELESAVFRNDHISVLAFDVIVDQNIGDFDERDIERLKISVLEGMFNKGNVELTTSILSLKRDSNYVTPDEKYSVNQLQLLSARVVSVTPLKKGFKLTLSAHAGLGFTVKGLVGENNEAVREAEYKLFKLARECMECVKETIRQVGYFPIEAGVKVQLNKNNSYIALAGDYRKSGKVTTIPGEDKLLLSTDPYGIRVSENNAIIPLSFEIGHQLSSGPVTMFARGERISYRSAVDVSDDFTTAPGATDRSTDQVSFKIGVRVKFGGLFR